MLSKALTINRRLFWAACLWLASPVAFCQNNTLTLQAFLQQVREQHPVSRQAFLLQDQARAAMLAARGGFDPKLYGSLERKSFDGKNYFNFGEGGLKMPSWFGLEGKIGYNYARGTFLNPENQLPADGQAVLGFSLSLLQGLLIDDRRANLFQARILQNTNEATRQAIQNELMLEAAKSYWNWSLAQAWLRVYEDALVIASTRLEGIRESWRQGDKPAIDTLEALIQVQDRTLQLNDARLLLRNSRLELQNFRWNNDAPVMPDTTLLPEAPGAGMFETDLLNAAADELAERHPLIRQYDFKLQELDVERRLKAEQLKPRLDLEYNLLGRGPDLTPDQNGNFTGLFRENYKLGVQFGFPLLLRKERGSLQLADLKILDARYERSHKQLEIKNKIVVYQNEIRTLRQQLQTAVEMRDNYARLLAGENEKFAIGESSLFLVNSRENKLIEANLKLLKLQAEIAKSAASLRWAAGLPD
ncbi:MAG: hypothetical protein RI973_991 [Bacteroidota bacterium]|jgi:outer membrane protein TolC